MLTERDSSKDEAVVFVFIIATVSLLIWALIRPFVHSWIEVYWVHDHLQLSSPWLDLLTAS